MADGEINRNGATIRIDDDGGVQVEPAEGQEVEYTGPDRGTDAIRESVETEEGDITNETHVRIDRGEDTDPITAGTWTIIGNATVEDSRGEVDGSQSFTPDKTAEYRIEAYATVSGGSSGDDYGIRLRNTTDGSNAVELLYDGMSDRFAPSFSITRELEAGKEYEVQVRNENSSFVIEGPGRLSRYAIVREVVKA